MKTETKIKDKLTELSSRRSEVWRMGRPSNPVNVRDAAERQRIDLEARIATLRWVLSPEWDEVF